jgi:hypothetical protein
MRAMNADLGRAISVACACVALAACSTGSRTDLAPEPVVQEDLQPLPTGPLTASQIKTALSEKTFRYSSGDRKGTVTYYGDGTFSYEEDGKGAGTGVWQPSDGKLCEARDPTTFLPKGTSSTCNPIASDGSVFTAGKLQLTPA